MSQPGEDGPEDQWPQAELEAGRRGQGRPPINEAHGGWYGAVGVNAEVFEDLELAQGVAEEVQATWHAFVKSAESQEAVGEAIYASMFEAAPSLQSLFKTPRGVMAMRFMSGLNQIIGALHDPKGLKVIVEALGFQHLDVEVTAPRVVVFRDAIVDLLQGEMGDGFTQRAQDGWCTMLNYVGGANIYVRVKFAERLRILASSWAAANNKHLEGEAAEEQPAEDEKAARQAQGGGAAAAAADRGKDRAMRARAGRRRRPAVPPKPGLAGRASWAGSAAPSGGWSNRSMPTTYNDMFALTAAVMGLEGRRWMGEVLASFDTIVTNISRSYRLQEECDVLGLRLAKYKGAIDLAEFKAVMLASLRSLVPQEWGSAHEVAWSWLWENVERMLRNLMGKPALQQRALEKLWDGLDDAAQAALRRDIYSQFFALAPAGQDFFKQSATRLHIIVDKVRSMTLEIYKDPQGTVEDISLVGLRHVGYGIPPDLFGPYVSACVQVVRSMTDDDMAESAFRWSLSLISRILMRVVSEGSTIVMKAINADSGKQLQSALSCAPRGKRALWVLNVQVGTQSISPLLWAIESGSLQAAKAIIVDLLTIRGDRDCYYYGLDTLFERHPDVIKRLCLDAPALLPTFLDGLVWRSRIAANGKRRVNYYLKHLLVDAEGKFSRATEWIASSHDPELACHPVVSLVADTVWARVAFRAFLAGKVGFLFGLVIFLCSQSILIHVGGIQEGEAATTDAPHAVDQPFWVRCAIFVCRCFVYSFSMARWTLYHLRRAHGDWRAGEPLKACWLPLPAYLGNWQDLSSLVLTVLLMTMLCLEPIVRCLGATAGEQLFTETCEGGRDVLSMYSLVSTAAVLMHFWLLRDLAVLSTRVSAFALICGRVLSEVALFFVALTFVLLSFASAISALRQNDPDFAGIPKSGLMLLKVTLGMLDGSRYEALQEHPALLLALFVYIITTVVFLLNMLTAQLSCSYNSVCLDMLGHACLNRIMIITETMPSVEKRRWERFVQSLHLDERIEFGEGDVGLAGGMQVLERASANLSTFDRIRRFGGSTSPAAPWPQEGSHDDEGDRFDRLEKIMKKAVKRMAKSSAEKDRSSSSGSSTMQSSGWGSDAGLSDNQSHISE